MNDLVIINGKEITRIDYKNTAVVTLKMVDELHERPTSTAKRNFRANKKHFIQGEDYFMVPYEEWSQIMVRRNSSDHTDKDTLVGRISSDQEDDLDDAFHCMKGRNSSLQNGGKRGPIVFLTETGYLMLIKSFTDDLSWKTQRQLVNRYFRQTGGYDFRDTGGFLPRPGLSMEAIAQLCKEADKYLKGKAALRALAFHGKMPVDDLVAEIEQTAVVNSSLAGTVAQYFDALREIDATRFGITTGTTEEGNPYVQGEGSHFYRAFLYLQRERKLPKFFTSLQSLGYTLSRESAALEYLGIKRTGAVRKYQGHRFNRYEFVKEKES